MKKFFSLCICLCFLNFFIYAASNNIELIPGLKHHFHPVSTSNTEAQEYFNQGMTFLFTYNEDGAYRSFSEAAKKDPQLAMAYWGIAMSLSEMENITPEMKKEINQALNKAQSLSDKASKNEQDYIYCLSQKIPNNPQLSKADIEKNYKEAMHQLIQKYPDDLDAKVIFGEHLMGKEHHSLWNNDGSPGPNALEIVDLFETVLQRDPYHIGALHFHVHSMEGSKHSERALLSAIRARNLLPASGHFLHMSSHIFLNTGDYMLAGICNDEAVQADIAYEKKYGQENHYLLSDIFHCYDYAITSYAFAGRFNDAYERAVALEKFYLPYYPTQKKYEFYLFAQPQILWRFHHWQELISQKEYDKEMHTANAFIHFTKALAYAEGKDTKKASEQLELFIEDAKNVNQSIINISPKNFFNTAQHIIEAKLAKANGQKKESLELLLIAMKAQGDQPLDWYFPIYEMLGAEYLLNQEPQKAEYYFRKDLERNYRNPRSLYGLYESLKAQNRTIEALWVENAYKNAWKDSTTQLTIQDIAL